MDYHELTLAEFLTFYRNLTTTESGGQDVTKFCVTFVISGEFTIAEVWTTKRGVILPPAAYRFRITPEYKVIRYEGSD